MILNATIVVQAVHFFIAYILINTLLLKPAVRIIISEQEHKSSLKQNIDQIKKLVSQREQAKNEQWRFFKTLFAQEMPIILPKYPKPLDIVVPHLVLMPADEQKLLVQKIVSTIIKRVEHVH